MPAQGAKDDYNVVLDEIHHIMNQNPEYTLTWTGDLNADVTRKQQMRNFSVHSVKKTT